MNIAKILKDAPRGTKLYSPLCGECFLIEVSKDGEFMHIRDYDVANPITLNKYGKSSWKDSEILLFPSKENRDWSTFKVEPQFPTTTFECAEIFDIENQVQEVHGYKDKQLQALQKLLIARDAWWKVDNWKPNWVEETMKYGIICRHNKIRKDYTMSVSMVLSFRTEEIRDKFLETFGDLIEQCKELI